MSVNSLGELSHVHLPDASPTGPSPSPSASPGPSPFARVLHALGTEAQKGEATVKGALDASRSGRSLGGVELLVLQAGIYRYSEVIDLAAKLVDRASTDIKTVIQGQ